MWQKCPVCDGTGSYKKIINSDSFEKIKKFSRSQLFEFNTAIKKGFRFYQKKGSDGSILEMEDYSHWYDFFHELQDYLYDNAVRIKEWTYQIEGLEIFSPPSQIVEGLIIELLKKNQHKELDDEKQKLCYEKL